MQRRTWLKLGISGGAVLAVIAGGTVLSYEDAWRDGRLSSAGTSVIRSIARAVLLGSLPVQHVAHEVALTAHVERMESTLRVMTPSTQHEANNLLSLLATHPGRLLITGLLAPWPDAHVAQVQGALQSMRVSRIMLRRQAYHALRDLTHAAYFADSGSWTQLGYPGPMQLG